VTAAVAVAAAAFLCGFTAGALLTLHLLARMRRSLRHPGLTRLRDDLARSRDSAGQPGTGGRQ